MISRKILVTFFSFFRTIFPIFTWFLDGYFGCRFCTVHNTQCNVSLTKGKCKLSHFSWTAPCAHRLSSAAKLRSATLVRYCLSALFCSFSAIRLVLLLKAEKNLIEIGLLSFCCKKPDDDPISCQQYLTAFFDTDSFSIGFSRIFPSFNLGAFPGGPSF